MKRKYSRPLRGIESTRRAVGCVMVIAMGTLACGDETLGPIDDSSLNTGLANLSEGPRHHTGEGHWTTDKGPLPITSSAREMEAFEAILQANAGPPVAGYQPAEIYYGERTSLSQSQVTVVAGTKPVCLVSHRTPSMGAYTQLSLGNHRQYAAMHGYSVIQYRGYLTGPRYMDADADKVVNRYGLYWQKIASVKDALEMRMSDGTPRCNWVMWLDGDVLMTDLNRPIESVLAPWASPAVAASGAGKDVVLALQESYHPGVLLNAGVFFVKNTDAGNSFIDKLFATEPAYRGRTQFGDQDVIHHIALDMDYSLMADLTWKQVASRLRPEIGVARSRAFNAFYKGKRKAQLADGDPYWQRGDFACHFSGYSTEDRVAGMQEVLEQLARAEGEK